MFYNSEMQNSSFFPEIKITGSIYVKNLLLLLLILRSAIMTGQGISLLQDADTLAGWGDVVITEIMADPFPPVAWEEEYIELFNRGEQMINLQGWMLKVGERNKILSGNHLADPLSPGDYRCIPVTSLPNEGSSLQLFSDAGRLIHAVSYRSPPFAPGWKMEGGWSLESPDPDCVCNVSRHWVYSGDPGGGTPGAPNSVHAKVEDLQAPVFLYHGFDREGKLCLYFSESLRFVERAEASVRIRPGDSRPLLAGVPAPFRNRIELVLPGPFQGIWELRLSLPPVYDCSGNRGNYPDVDAARARIPAKGGILLSEIMFSPAGDRPEFVELFNAGPGPVDLEDLALGLSDLQGDRPERFVALSDHSRILHQGQYAVLCRRSDELMIAYGLGISGKWAGLEGFPALPDHGGFVVLADRAGNPLDEAPYGDDMHLEFPADHRGISLERLDFGRPGLDRENWHSAASTAGYCTPGMQNSQAIRSHYGSGSGIELAVEPKVFSPDNDGSGDILEIFLELAEHGTFLRLWITDPVGRPLRILADMESGGGNCRFTWDGRDSQACLQPEGFYVVHLLTVNPHSGEKIRQRVAVGLVYP